jgi:antitoxin HicB
MKERGNKNMDEQFKYPFEISHLSDEEGGGYLISFPDLPGCISDGDSIEEAINNGIDAMNSWLETAQEFNDPISEPFSSKASGRFVQRIPKSLHVRLAARAKQEGVSMNALVTSILSESMGKKEARQ